MTAPPRFDRQQAGRDAEDHAARFLQSQQLLILERNYRCRTGEIDIVAQTRDGIVVIAEVRLRSHRGFGGGAASVDFHKQRRITRATRHLLATRRQWSRCALRFDVLDLKPAPDGYEVNWIRSAFSAD